jgi:hypothetical protein
MHLVINVKTSKEVWDKLSTTFVTKDITSNVFATICFYNQKMNELENVEKHLNTFTILRTQLEVVRTIVVDE